MISNYGAFATLLRMELYGLSTDTKPTDTYCGVTIPNGSSFREIDTGKTYLYDADSKAWFEQ